MFNISKNKNSYQFLAYLGVVPFLVLALITLFVESKESAIIDFEFFFYTYSLAIICFICGSHWGTVTKNVKNNFGNILILSNVITLVAWLAISFNDKSYTLIVNVLCFIALLLVDLFLLKKKLIKPDYFKTRVIASSFVICLTIIVLISI